jgi:phosphohistidine phosphatase
VERRLTPHGQEQARTVGDRLRAEGLQVQHALCSVAVRARQTLAALGLTAPAHYLDRLYNAGSDTLVEVVRELDDRIEVALLVGHAPGVPSLVYDLADPASSTAAAMAAVEGRFPAGTLARLEVRGAWSELADVRLSDVWLPAA